jgi:ubiquinone/menaquinone biosynthesis C-methylase UbiE
MYDNDKQREHYDRLMADRRPSKGLSCGYEARFDPYLLDRRPELVQEFHNIFDKAFPREPERLLDIGCGSGLYLPVLCKKAGMIVGLDISTGMINAAQELIEAKGLSNVELRVGGAEAMPFPDASFDSVLGFDVLHHVPDVHRALEEVHRVLRPGGLFVSIEPNVLNPAVWFAHVLPAEERGALRYNYPWAIKRLLRKHFGAVNSRYINHVTAPNSKTVLAGIRLLDRLTRFWPFRYFSIRMLMTVHKQEEAADQAGE